MMYINPWLEKKIAAIVNIPAPAAGFLGGRKMEFRLFLENIAENMFIYVRINPFGTARSGLCVGAGPEGIPATLDFPATVTSP